MTYLNSDVDPQIVKKRALSYINIFPPLSHSNIMKLGIV